MKERSQENHEQGFPPFIKCLIPKGMESDLSKSKRVLEAEKSIRFRDSGDERVWFQPQHLKPASDKVERRPTQEVPSQPYILGDPDQASQNLGFSLTK